MYMLISFQFAKPLGTPVPEKLLSTDNMENLKNDPNAKRITVEYKSRFIVEKEVLEPNSILQWDFQTLDYDIRMGLCFRREEKSNSEEIIPAHRVDSHLFPESGSFMCEKPGICKYHSYYFYCLSQLHSCLLPLHSKSNEHT